MSAAPQAWAATAVAQGSDEAAVEVRGLTKSFGRGTLGPAVLEDVDLRVDPGEFVCVLGRRSALVFQEPALCPWLTALGNVELALRLRGVPRSRRRSEAERLLALVRLGGAEDRRVHQLSGGMRQRVALARALAQECQVLLMDEPFGALDAITRDVLHEELMRIWSETGLSIVFVTHNVREAVRLGQRVVLLSSRPAQVVREWRVDLDEFGRIESPAVARLSGEITDRLREEISRHGGA